MSKLLWVRVKDFVGLLNRWSSIFTIVMLVEGVLSIWDYHCMGPAFICALLSNKFREEERKQANDLNDGSKEGVR